MRVQYGKLSDIYGRKRLLLVSYFLFAVGCILRYLIFPFAITWY